MVDLEGDLYEVLDRERLVALTRRPDIGQILLISLAGIEQELGERVQAGAAVRNGNPKPG